MTRVLGAASRHVMGWIGGGALRVTASGLALGLLGVVGFTRLLRTARFEVSPLEPVIYGWVVLVLRGTGMLAARLPARRAMRVDSVAALSEDG